MQLDFEHGDNYIIVRCTAPTRLDALNKDEFYHSVLSVYHPGKAVILDCQNLDYIDSAGISALISLRKRVVENADRLILVGLNRDLIDLFQISRLHRVFDIVDTLEMALQRLNRTYRRFPSADAIEIKLKAEPRGDALVVRLLAPDSLIEANCTEFIEKFKNIIKSHKRILFDIDNLKNIDGMGIAALVHVQSYTRKQGKELVFVYRSETLRRLFKMYHVDDLFAGKPDLEEALAGRPAQDANGTPKTSKQERPGRPKVNRRNRSHADYVDLQFIRSTKKGMVEPL